MGTLRAKLFDRNRYAKRYPLIRAPRRMVYRADETMAIEVGSISFSDSDSGTLQFETPFPDTSYQLAIAVRDGGDDEGANINAWISVRTASAVTIRTGNDFTGYVDVFAIRIG